MSMSEEEWRETFHIRAKRLVDLIDLNAPNLIIAREVVMIEQAMEKCLDEDIIKRARAEIGILK